MPHLCQAILRSLLFVTAAALAASCNGPVTPAAGPLTGGQQSSSPAALTFVTINNPKDLTFNQLLGVNDKGKIVGYFGSGASGHPNRGYFVRPKDYTRFKNQDYPGSAQTQVVAVNNVGVTAGFWVDGSGVNRGFIH